jgi:dolichyl-phosphate-mannose-protein mannosyltransferase
MRETAPPRGDPVSSPEHEDEHEHESETAVAADRRRPPLASARTFGAIAIALLVAGGVAYRFWLALGPLGQAPNSDETVVGLMALHLWRHHEVQTFYWHQPYGGTLQTWLMAPVVGLFGTSIFSLRLVTTLEGIAAAIVTWRIARHFFARQVALLAGVVALWWPLSLVYFSTQERLFYALTVLLGLVAVLMAVNIDEKPALLRHWLVLGLCVGSGWWLAPDIIYYALPIVLYLLARGHWREWRGIAIAAVTFLASSSAWTYTNLHSGFKSLRSPDWAGSSTYWTRLEFFFKTGLPFSLGLRHAWTARWFGGPHIGVILFRVGIVILVFALVLAFRRIRSSASIIVLLVVVAPLVYAWFPPTWRLNEGRYLFFFASLLPLLVCEVMQFRVGQAVVLGFVAVTAVMFIRDYGTTPPGPSMTPVARVLEANGYNTAVAQYWIAYDLTYATGEHIIASPLPGQPGARYKPYIEEIRGSNPAYVFVNLRTGIPDGKLTQALENAKIPYRVVKAGAYAAVLPEKPFIFVP